jgi:long-chain fatty acid transport protein
MKRLHVTALLAGCATLAAMGQAGAGGFSRGTADTDLIFEEGNFNMRASVTVVMPQRGYETITAPTNVPSPPFPPQAIPAGTYDSTDGKYSQTYVIPSTAIKFNLTDDLRCAGTYTQPFGADSEYGPQAVLIGSMADGTGTMREGFTSNEFGATCGYKFDLAKGRAWIIGGAFVQDFDYSQTVQFTFGGPGGLPPIGSTGTLKFKDDYQPGYRLGVAYEIPEIALRAQLLYRSAIDHSPSGGSGDTFTVQPPIGNALVFPTEGAGTLPQSLELKVQSGIAPGWLAFSSVRWTDWSVLDKLDYTIIAGGPFAGLGGPRELEYYYRDGWTVTGGVGHAFSETISGVVGFTWDRGVSTTEDTLSDSYTAAAGVSIKDKLGGEVRFGGAISYLTAASVSAEARPSAPGQVDPGASFAYTVDGDFVYALSAGYKIAW